MSWVSEHRADIVFIISIVVGVVLIIAGLFTNQSATILLGAGAIGIPGFSQATKEDSNE